MTKHTGKVYLVGSGLGEVEFLTVRAHQVLARAEVLVFDALADGALVQVAPETCRKLNVGKRGGQPSMHQSAINDLLVRHCEQGRRVVRLKSGDPFVFGRSQAEIQALTEARCPFEVVPGLSSALTAPLVAGIPLTDPVLSQGFTVVTGHDPEALDWQTLARMDTLVILMGGRSLPDIVRRLEIQGRSPQTPIAVIRWAGRPQQRIWEATLSTIVRETRGEPLSPCVIVIGEVVGLRFYLKASPDPPGFDQSDVFKEQPPVEPPPQRAEQAPEVMQPEIIQADGQQDTASIDFDEPASTLPEAVLIDADEPASTPPEAVLINAHDELALTLSEATLIDATEPAETPAEAILIDTDESALTSSEAVLLDAGDEPASTLSEATLINADEPAETPAEAIPLTSTQLDFAPLDSAMTSPSSPPSLSSAPLPLPLSGKTILVTRAASQSSQFVNRLLQEGATVVDLPALEIVPPSSWQELDDAIAQLASFDWLMLTSANSVEYFFDRLADREFPSGLKLAVVGDKTAQTLEKRGLKPDFVPREFIADSLVAQFPEALEGTRILFPRVESGGRDVIVRDFTRQGARVIEVAAYQSRCPEAIAPAALAALQNRTVDVVTFASSKTVKHFCQLLERSQPDSSWQVWLTGVCIASIGPQTTQTCNDLLGRVDAEAKEYTLEGLIVAIIRWFEATQQA